MASTTELCHVGRHWQLLQGMFLSHSDVEYGIFLLFMWPATVTERILSIQDMFIILTSSCGRMLPRQRGYRSLAGANGSAGALRGNRSDDENRLIDQLDEEWED